MGKTGKKEFKDAKKDSFQVKKDPGAVVKAKDKRKKANTKKVMEKVGRDIATADADFQELQSKLVKEKENKKEKLVEKKQVKRNEPSNRTSVPHKKQLEETAHILSNL